jgi:hypothetical protein
MKDFYEKLADTGNDLMKIGFGAIVGLVIFGIVAVIAIIGLVVYLVFFSGSDTPASSAIPQAVQTEAPASAIRYPNVEGLCFRTPMGDIGKVMEQDNDRLDMSFRGGPRVTYLYDQVVNADCGYLPKG